MKRARGHNPRITLHRDGGVTLSGLRYDDLRSILTAARLYRYDHEFRPEPEEGPHSEIIARNNRDAATWHRRMEYLIDAASRALSEAIQGSHPPRPKTVKERIRDALEERNFRKRLQEVIDAVCHRAVTPTPGTE